MTICHYMVCGLNRAFKLDWAPSLAWGLGRHIRFRSSIRFLTVTGEKSSIEMRRNVSEFVVNAQFGASSAQAAVMKLLHSHFSSFTEFP